MRYIHCKRCKIEWEVPADLLCTPECERCDKRGTEGRLPPEEYPNASKGFIF